jgi:hypothetical protein
VFDAIPYYGVLAMESLCNVVGVRLYEEPRHTVIDRVGEVEIRRYAPRVAAAVAFSPSVLDRGDAFKMLFDYIAGANVRADKIAMTAPVELRRERVSPAELIAPVERNAPAERIAMTAPVQSSNGRMVFFLPAEYGVTTAPRPKDHRVQIVAVPSETIAVLRFAGLGGISPLRQRQLLSTLIRSKWAAVGEPFMYYYDAPFTLPFLRRNEAAVLVEPRG